MNGGLTQRNTSAYQRQQKHRDKMRTSFQQVDFETNIPVFKRQIAVHSLVGETTKSTIILVRKAVS
jgi:hypothetical protein